MVFAADAAERRMPMGVDIQSASMWKRISAWLFDSILLVSVVVLMALMLSKLFGYDGYNAKLEAAYDKYQTQYDVDFSQPEGPEDAAEEEKTAYKQRYEEADAALKADKDALHALGVITSLILLIPTIGLLLAMLLMEFLIPLLLKNGQTIGKKIFGIGVVRVDAVRLTGLQLFVRSILSKYTVCMMIPLYMIMLMGTLGIISLAVAGGLLIAQLICPLANREHRGLHDLLAGTVAVDLPSQRVFANAGERMEYIKKEHAERAARQDY